MANTKILYLEANKRNFTDKFLMKNQGYWLRGSDGKIDCKRRMHPDPPWIYTKPRANMNCHFWHKILFDVISGQSQVPIPCHSCWKVVLMPRNLEELVATYFMQLHLDRPCKCGTEGDRPNTDRLYGAYWYTGSKEEGKEVYELVKATMAQTKVWVRNLMGAHIVAKFYEKGETLPFAQGEMIAEGLPNIILKRGCTEYEQSLGRSDEWKIEDGQQEAEYLATDAFVQDMPNFRQSDHQLAHVFYNWIHRAFQWGDQSYLRFTNNNRLFDPPVTYHTGSKPQPAVCPAPTDPHGPGGKQDG